MILTTLIENTSIKSDLQSEHGLSLLIQTKKHKILFDTGASGDFVDNAKKMNINLSNIDLAIISHGHYDHSGGLKKLVELLPDVKIYIRKSSFEPHYSHRPPHEGKFIGIDSLLFGYKNFIFTDPRMKIDDELELFSDVSELRNRPYLNKYLTKMSEGLEVADDFTHEQHLIIHEDEKTILVAGCAHQGIVNIIKKASLMGRPITHVIGGFHLHNRSKDSSDNSEEIDALTEVLASMPIRFYTCHCTGIGPYLRMKETLKDKIVYCSTGSVNIL